MSGTESNNSDIECGQIMEILTELRDKSDKNNDLLLSLIEKVQFLENALQPINSKKVKNEVKNNPSVEKSVNETSTLSAQSAMITPSKKYSRINTFFKDLYSSGDPRLMTMLEGVFGEQMESKFENILNEYYESNPKMKKTPNRDNEQIWAFINKNHTELAKNIKALKVKVNESINTQVDNTELNNEPEDHTEDQGLNF